jgi:GTP pyrophosphokinase
MVLASQTAETTLDSFSAGLSEADRSSVADALEYAQALYADRLLSTGERALEHALGMAACVAELRLDAATRAAALLFSAPAFEDGAAAKLEPRFGQAVAALVSGISRLNELRVVTRASVEAERTALRASQIEALRKMLLAMVEDVRVVLLRLASRTQTLRFLARSPDATATSQRRPVAQETLDLYAPLANRLGVWQLKWELEDLSFRFLEPELYKRIAGMLDERRAEREAFIARAIADLARALAAAGVHADISGRPKHIYSIYGKMRSKNLAFSELRDVRALRVLVDEVRDCYTALGIVHDLWQPIPGELDDYIARPKENLYRSLHTAVSGPDRRPLEVQIRTHEMHHTAELGVAAHWRYKEGEGRARDPFGDKIAMLRQMLAWRDEVVDASDWVEQYKRAALDDTIYVLTPQNRVIDLPRGSTPVDFAYAVHTGLGHRCRGAKVNGAIVPLDHELGNGDRVEIIAARAGTQASGPSRDWMNPALGYIASSRARNKVRQWFNSLEHEQTVAAGRAAVEKELQREGRTGASLAELASALGFDRSEDLFVAVGREEVGPRQLQRAIRGETEPDARDERVAPGELPSPVASPGAGGITVLGVDRLMTQLARCCKPVPPDRITGFVTRGRGISIHRSECASLARLRERYPDRLLEAQWGEPGRSSQKFLVDVVVRAAERLGLLRDISDVLARAQVRISGLQSHVRDSSATLFLTVEVGSLDDLRSTLPLVEAVHGVSTARRR